MKPPVTTVSHFTARAKRQVAARAFHAPRQAEQRYVRGLVKVFKGVQDAYMTFFRKALPEIAKKGDGAGDGIGWRRDGINKFSGELDLLGIRIAAQIPGKVDPLFTRMSRDVQKANAREQHKLLGVREHDIGFEPAIAAAREWNIRLVQDAQRAYAQQVRDEFEDPANFGLRVEDIEARLLERGNIWDSRAELIARDQTLKLNGQINGIRQQNAGVSQYIWSTSKDERVRETHAELEGETFTWGVPPAVGEPGQDYQCRCVALPVIEELEGI